MLRCSQVTLYYLDDLYLQEESFAHLAVVFKLRLLLEEAKALLLSLGFLLNLASVDFFLVVGAPALEDDPVDSGVGVLQQLSHRDCSPAVGQLVGVTLLGLLLQRNDKFELHL